MLRKRIMPIVALAGIMAASLIALPQPSGASSHREAPLISLDPAADNTDVYAFVSPDKPDTVTILANYIPLQEPAGGPNFASFDPNARYEIHIDNDGDSKEDITYRFNFTTKVGNQDTFLYNTGRIESLDDPDWNIKQFYRVTRIDEDGRSNSRGKVLGDNLPSPPVNVGARSTPNYEALAAAAVKQLSDGSMVFAGQRDDPFFVDLGSVFDLLGLRPFNALHAIPLPTAPGKDDVGGYNVHTIAMQIPITQLTRDGKKPKDANDPNAVIGIYASASRQAIRVILPDGSQRNEGKFVQVSRLANPLVNEVVIPLRDKDRWNRTDPRNDKQFQKYYTNPEVTRLENGLYDALDNAAETNRNDLVAILLTGVPSLNFTGNTPADLLRLNMAIPPSATPSRFGVLDGDFAGFPNGRRLADDVVDIEVRAFAEGYGPILNQALGLPNRSPNNTLGDGVDANDLPFLNTFPYVGTPHQGYEHVD
jgi:hypothetical protein